MTLLMKRRSRLKRCNQQTNFKTRTSCVLIQKYTSWFYTPVLLLQWQYNLVVTVKTLNRVSALQPSSGWLDANLSWNVRLVCKTCGEVVCTTQGCESTGRFVVLKRRGNPLQTSGDTVIVRSIRVEGTFDMEFDEHESFDFPWSFRVETDHGTYVTVDGAKMDNNGSYKYSTNSDSSDSSNSENDELFGGNGEAHGHNVPYISEVFCELHQG
ncbi:hypothetical protein COLO4_31285 [Corchorus olitorius]|uniref:Uncharacterized protein n=1 Tax=Corchorus olitorius TaxID=93759 RepID=A0A1R3H4X2_9ROSI|nr:hypothetical protein COLO4_31285 [Corchorus olitorius]